MRPVNLTNTNAKSEKKIYRRKFMELSSLVLAGTAFSWM